MFVKMISCFTVAVLCAGILVQSVHADTINHSITIVEPELGLEITGPTENTYTVVQSATWTTGVESKMKAKNTGNISGDLFTKVPTVPEGITLSNEPDEPGEMVVRATLNDGTEGWTTGFIGTYETSVARPGGLGETRPAMNAGEVLEITTHINISAGTPVGSYDLPVEWILKPAQ